MRICAEKKLTITVGDSIELVMNGSNGNVELKASKVKVEASGNIQANANGSMKLQTGNMIMEANAMLKMSSSGAAVLSGTPIKIG